jgi:AsmA family protein
MTPRRRLAWIAASVLGALVLVVGISEATGWRYLRQPLQSVLQRAGGAPVRLDGTFRAHLLWRPRIEVEHLHIGAAPGFAAPHFVAGREVAVGWRWADLWRWRRGDTLHVRAISAAALDLQLIRDAQGRASWQLFSRDSPKTEPDQPPEFPRFGRLDLAAGRIVVDDRILDTQLRVEVRGGEGSSPGAQGGYQAAVTGRYRTLPVNLALRSGGALPLLRDDDEDNKAPAMTPLRVEGQFGAARVLFDGQAAALMGGRHIDGTLRFGGPSLAQVFGPLGLTLPQTPAFSLLGRLVHHNGVWGLRADKATIGNSELGGDFRYDSNAKPPLLSGRLSGPRLALADLGPAIGARTGGNRDLPVSAAPPAGQAGRVLPQKRFDVPSLRAMNADVQVAMDELVFATSAMAAMRDLRTHVRLNDGVLDLQSLQAQVAGGRLSGSTRLETRNEPARWTARLQFTGVDVATWLRGLKTPEGKRKAPDEKQARTARQQRQQALNRPDQPPPAYLTGVLDAQVDVVGRGSSTAEILSTLDGPVHVGLREGTMSHLVTEAIGLDLAQALGVVITGDRALPLRCARFDFNTQDGVMHLKRGVLDNPDSTIRVAGQIDLRNESLALAARAKPKDVSPASLRAPVTVTGTLSNPSFGVEGKQLTGRVLGALVLGTVAGPLAALLPMIDTGTEKEKDPCAAPNRAADAPAAIKQPDAAGAKADAAGSKKVDAAAGAKANGAGSKADATSSRAAASAPAR